jgi:TatD DNase family protein
MNFDWFDNDRVAVIEKARQAGVVRILNPGINVTTSQEAVALAANTPEVYAAIGVHPNDALSWNNHTLIDLRRLVKYPKVSAIGEIGLDYYRDRAPKSLQHEVFVTQLNLAHEADLPVVIHSRNKSENDQQAIQDVLELLSDWVAELESNGSKLSKHPGVLHSYSGNLAMAKRAVDLNFMIGVTGPVTFKKAQGLREVIAGLPVENLLIETDAPFLTPHPYRGKRNEPAYVRYVCEKIAEIHQMPVEKIAGITRINAERLFNW